MGCACSSDKLIQSNALVSDYVPSLTRYQIWTVEKTWHKVTTKIANLGMIAFIGMFESRPELINVFSSFEGKELSELRHSRLLHEHALRVMATVESVISQIDDLPAVAKTLKEVGEIHRRYNVPSDLFQVILPHFLTAIRQHLDSSWSNDVESAWTKLFDVIIYYMTDGDVINTDLKPSVQKNGTSL